MAGTLKERKSKFDNSYSVIASMCYSGFVIPTRDSRISNPHFGIRDCKSRLTSDIKGNTVLRYSGFVIPSRVQRISNPHFGIRDCKSRLTGDVKQKMQYCFVLVGICNPVLGSADFKSAFWHFKMANLD